MQFILHKVCCMSLDSSSKFYPDSDKNRQFFFSRTQWQPCERILGLEPIAM